MLTFLEHCTGNSPIASIIWLHGLGADGSDFLPIAQEIALPFAVRYVFPNAPEMPVSINGGYIMPAWYDIFSANIDAQQDETGIRRSQRQIEELITRETERGIPAGKVLLAGFSQGGAIALQAALRHTEQIAGVIALSTYLPLHASLAIEASKANHGTPIFMAHGTMDSVIPIATAEASADFLQQSGYTVEWHDYPMPHTVCGEEIVAIQEFLLRVLG